MYTEEIYPVSLMNGGKTLSKFRQNGGNILKMQYLFNSLPAK